MNFSVVIAAYEAERTVGAAVESVLAQTCQDFEVVVIDDGSRDSTAAVAEEIATQDDRVRVYRQANGGPSAARNRGIALARSEHYVSMLDSDDLFLPSYLTEMGSALESDPEAGFAYTDAWVLDETTGRFHKDTAMGRRQRRLAKTLSPEQFAAELLRVNFIYNAVTVRRHVLERAGGYDPNMVYSEDYELWLRFTALGFSAVRVPGPLAVKRDRPDSLTANEAEMIAGTLTAYTAALQRHPVVPYFGELAKARLDQIRAAERRQSTAKARIVALPRNALAAATRPWRRRWALRSAPPPDVARAFPGLGVCRGRRTLRAGAR